MGQYQLRLLSETGSSLLTVECEALAVVVPRVLGGKILEVEVGVMHVANFILLVDEITIQDISE